MEDLTEVTYDQLKTLTQNCGVVVAIAHTPTCGTCQIAKKMLMIIKSMLNQVKFLSVNLNYNEELAMQEEIMSVPCILIYKDRNCVEKIYAFGSVPNLYKKITSYL